MKSSHHHSTATDDATDETPTLGPFVASYYGYGVIFIFVIFWSAVIAAVAINKLFKSQKKIYYSAVYLTACMLLNYVYATLSHDQARSLMGFMVGTMIFQGGLFIVSLTILSIHLSIGKKVQGKFKQY